MIPCRSALQTAVPASLEKRLEIVAAIRAFAAQDENDRRGKQAEIAALRRDCALLRRSLPGLLHEAIAEAWRECDPRLRSHVIKYDPDQPRVPAGRPEGGKWTNEDAGQPSNGSNDEAGPHGDALPVDYGAADVGTRTDAENDNLTSGQTCRRAYAIGMARVRVKSSLSAEDYLTARYQLAGALGLCLNYANEMHPVPREGVFVEFFGTGAVIFRRGRAPYYRSF